VERLHVRALREQRSFVDLVEELLKREAKG
jgi:hypothetical protein